MSERVTIGLIGYGYWGPNLARNFSNAEQAKLVAIADRSAAHLQRAAKAYPDCQLVSDYHDFFKMGVQAVSIATPPASHYEIALACLEHGLHTLIEKPITLDAAQAEHLIQVAQEKHLTLMVGHTFEFNPAIRFVKQLIDQGDLGDVFYIDTVRVNMGGFQANANAMWDLAPHDISILLYLLGEEPQSVTVQGVDSITHGHIDLAYMSLRFPSGIHGHIQVSWLSPRKIRQLTVVGSQRMVVVDDVEPIEKVKIYDKSVSAPLPYTETLEEFHWSYRHGDVRIPHIPYSEPLQLETQEFLDCIRSGSTPSTDGANGLRVVKVLEAGDRSLQAGGQRVDYIPVH